MVRSARQPYRQFRKPVVISLHLGPGDEAIYSEHNFLVYKIAILARGATPVVAPEKDLTADVDAILARVAAETRVVFIANPNNPTGTYLPFDEVKRLRAGLPDDVLLVLDAAYAEYVRRTDFVVWCKQHGLQALPATVDTVAAYLAALAAAGLKASTITRRCAGIRYMHRIAGIEPPTSSEAIKAVLSGIKRSVGSSVTRKAPATAETVRAIIAEIPTDLRGLRDRALLLLGFAGRFVAPSWSRSTL